MSKKYLEEKNGLNNEKNENLSDTVRIVTASPVNTYNPQSSSSSSSSSQYYNLSSSSSSRLPNNFISEKLDSLGVSIQGFEAYFGDFRKQSVNNFPVATLSNPKANKHLILDETFIKKTLYHADAEFYNPVLAKVSIKINFQRLNENELNVAKKIFLFNPNITYLDFQNLNQLDSKKGDLGKILEIIKQKHKITHITFKDSFTYTVKACMVLQVLQKIDCSEIIYLDLSKHSYHHNDYLPFFLERMVNTCPKLKFINLENCQEHSDTEVYEILSSKLGLKVTLHPVIYS